MNTANKTLDYYEEYDKEEIKTLRKKLKKVLSKDRYEHTLGVAYTAGSMAMAYQMEPYPAVLAGFLHDCAKCIDDSKKIEMCKEYKLPISNYELEHPYLLHAKLGAELARNIYGVNNEEIYWSIYYHTTGTEEMSMLQKIIYIADFIEPGRKVFPELKEIRACAFSDIDLCMFKILESSISFLQKKGMNSIEENTLIAYQYYKNLIESRNKHDK